LRNSAAGFMRKVVRRLKTFFIRLFGAVTNMVRTAEKSRLAGSANQPRLRRGAADAGRIRQTR
jgi:hypothetical protein